MDYGFISHYPHFIDKDTAEPSSSVSWASVLYSAKLSVTKGFFYQNGKDKHTKDKGKDYGQTFHRRNTIGQWMLKKKKRKANALVIMDIN